MGQKSGEKWTAAVDLQPAIPSPTGSLVGFTLLANSSLRSDPDCEAASGRAPRRYALEDLVENAYIYAQTPEHREGFAALLA